MRAHRSQFACYTLMRIFLPLLCLFLIVLCGALWWAQRHAGAEAEHAQSLENALQAVEWYTNESVNKALRAETEGDLVNARLFGDKAIESDLKAQGLRHDTASAWQAAGQPERARAAWQRAAKMAEARARMLADRIPPLQKQWEQARDSQHVSLHEAAVMYLQALIYTAEQWALVVQFSEVSADKDQIAAGKEALSKVLLPMQQNGLLDRLADEPQLAGSIEKIPQWQQVVLPTAR